AADGIRGWSVTGVQTCALPILVRVRRGDEEVLDEVLVTGRRADLPAAAAALRAVERDGVPLHVPLVGDRDDHVLFDDQVLGRERDRKSVRVGKEGRSRRER